MIRRKVLKVTVAYPTLASIPESDEVTEVDIEQVKTSHRVDWPDNWSELSPMWQASIIRELIERTIRLVLTGDEDHRRKVVEELAPMLRWAHPKKNKPKKRVAP